MQTARPEDRGFDPMRPNRVSAWMDRYVAERKFPGSSVLISRGGDEVYFYATGQRNMEAGLPFQRDTLARIYSMTKPITSLVMIMLVEEGRIHLDAPVSAVLPEFTDMHCLIPGAMMLEIAKTLTTPLHLAPARSSCTDCESVQVHSS